MFIEKHKGVSFTMQFPMWQSENWEDYPENPVIGHFGLEGKDVVIGDPQILMPGDFDGRWHAFYHGFFNHRIPRTIIISSPTTGCGGR